MKQKMHYYLMISCPGDVIKERELLKKCVEDINRERVEDWVELQYWVTDTFSDAGTQAQDSINEQLVAESDGLIAIFNARLGTPTRNYKCGTEEEIALMLKAGKHVSLLFNNRPTIDLTNSSSIEQISKLQEYKNEQSTKAYYRVFNDEESFTRLVRQEILLWLRKIVKEINAGDSGSNNPEDESRHDANEQFTAPKTDITIINDETPETSSRENKDTIDNEAGIMDCVVYITEAATVMVEELNNFSNCTSDLNEKTDAFSNKLQFVQNQSSGNGGIIALCKIFAKEVNSSKDTSSNILDKIEEKWNEIYKYLMICNKNGLSADDKIILRDSVTGLRQCFENESPKIEDLINMFLSIPNYQKDLKTSLNALANVYKRFKKFMIKAIDNCEEIASILMNID